MINYHCFKIKLNHYLSAGPPLSIVPSVSNEMLTDCICISVFLPDDDISFPFQRNIPKIHNITNQIHDFSAKNKGVDFLLFWLSHKILNKKTDMTVF